MSRSPTQLPSDCLPNALPMESSKFSVCWMLVILNASPKNIRLNLAIYISASNGIDVDIWTRYSVELWETSISFPSKKKNVVLSLFTAITRPFWNTPVWASRPDKLTSLPSDLNFGIAFGSFHFHLSKLQAKQIINQNFHPPKIVKFLSLNHIKWNQVKIFS